MDWKMRRGQIKHLLYEHCLNGRIDKELLKEQFNDLNNAEPTKHGRWKVNNETEEWVTIYCDQCHDGMWNRKGDPYPNYCFNCGARMDGGEND